MPAPYSSLLYSRGILGLLLCLVMASLPWPVFAADDPLEINSGATVEGQLAAETPYKSFKVVVPADAGFLNVALTSDQDLDLFLRHGSPIERDFFKEATASSASPTGNEWILIGAKGLPLMKPGTWYIDVAALGDQNTGATFKLTAHWGSAAEAPMPPAGYGLEGPAESSEEGVDGEVKDGDTFEVALDDDRNYRTFVIEVPDGATSLLVTVTGAERDMDLYAKQGSPIDDYEEDAQFRANGKSHNEALYIDHESDPPLTPGRWYIDVTRAVEDAAKVNLAVHLNVEAPTDFYAEHFMQHTTDLMLDQIVQATIDRSQDKYVSFRVEVPEGAKSLHIRSFGASLDTDLYVKHGAPISDYDDDFDYRAFSARLNERMDLSPESDPPLKAGVYYIDVVSFLDKDDSVTLGLVASIDEAPAFDDPAFEIPPFQEVEGITPLEQAIHATVEVACEAGTGSGSCLSPEGLILTNHHVLLDDESGETQTSGIFISFTREFDLPPLQIFEAECLHYDAELDLALLKVTRDIHGRDLPEILNLPHFRQADMASARIGTPIKIVGYPSVGGKSSRSSVSVTRGIISGFSRRDGKRNWFKTDARINAGNSGGAAVDESGRLLGVPTKEIIEEDDELGYCRPLTLLPKEWLELISGE